MKRLLALIGLLAIWSYEAVIHLNGISRAREALEVKTAGFGRILSTNNYYATCGTFEGTGTKAAYPDGEPFYSSLHGVYTADDLRSARNSSYTYNCLGARNGEWFASIFDPVLLPVFGRSRT